jgi:hypothetical protein
MAGFGIRCRQVGSCFVLLACDAFITSRYSIIAGSYSAILLIFIGLALLAMVGVPYLRLHPRSESNALPPLEALAPAL